MQIQLNSLGMGGGTLLRQDLPLSKNRLYEAAVWVKASQQMLVELTVRDSSHTVYGTQTINAGTSWAQIRLQVPIKADISGSFLVRPLGPGTLWVDDASLVNITSQYGSYITPESGGILSTSAGQWRFGSSESSGTGVLLNNKPIEGVSAVALMIDSGGNLVSSQPSTLQSVWQGNTWVNVDAQDSGATFQAPFSKSGIFKMPIPSNPIIDPNSAAIVKELASGTAPLCEHGGCPVHNIATGRFGIPVYYADSTTLRIPMPNIAHTTYWGDPLPGGSMPMPEGAMPNTGGDHKIEVIDMSARLIYDCWHYDSTAKTCEYGRIAPLDGDGAGPHGTTAAKTPQVAGLIRVSEVRAGKIDHALAFLSPFTMSASSGTNFRYPGTWGDGQYLGEGAIPEGARVQLDPSIDVDTIAGMTPMEKMVAHALQTYGAFAVDTGDSNMIFYGELPTGDDASNNPWPSVYGPEWTNMPHIPWDRLRVLAAGQ